MSEISKISVLYSRVSWERKTIIEFAEKKAESRQEARGDWIIRRNEGVRTSQRRKDIEIITKRTKAGHSKVCNIAM